MGSKTRNASNDYLALFVRVRRYVFIYSVWYIKSPREQLLWRHYTMHYEPHRHGWILDSQLHLGRPSVGQCVQPEPELDVRLQAIAGQAP